MSVGNSKQDEKKGGNSKTIGIVILVIIILALIGVIIYLMLSQSQEAKVEVPKEEKRDTVVTQDNVQDVVQQMEEKEILPPSYYTVAMNYDWHFATGDAVSTDAYVENDTSNTTPVYFDVVLASDEEKVLYKSPVIPVGSSLEGFALDTKLEAGTYDCVVIYHLVDDEQNTLSTLRVTVTLTVEG